MKYIRMLGLAGLVALALTAFTGTASATYLTSPPGTTYTGAFELRSGKITFHLGGFGEVVCSKSEMKGKVEFHGIGITAGGNLSSLTFEGCEPNTVTVLKAGALEISPAATTGNGTVIWNGGEIQVHISKGPTCTIKTSSTTTIGTLTGSNITKGNAVLDLEKPALPTSGFLCPATTVMTGLYAVISPTSLEVH
jgi:hypothetical protein